MQTLNIYGINIPIPESYKDCLKLAQSDYYRYCGQNVGLLRMWCYTLGHPLFAFSFWLRLCSYKSKVPILGGGNSLYIKGF